MSPNQTKYFLSSICRAQGQYKLQQQPNSRSAAARSPLSPPRPVGNANYYVGQTREAPSEPTYRMQQQRYVQQQQQQAPPQQQQQQQQQQHYGPQQTYSYGRVSFFLTISHCLKSITNELSL